MAEDNLLTIVVQKDHWGPAWLRNEKNGEMCCLGFASNQLGVPMSALENVTYPRRVTGFGETPEFAELVKKLEEQPPELLADNAFDLMAELNQTRGSLVFASDYQAVHGTYEKLLANINDSYHHAVRALKKDVPRNLTPEQRERNDEQLAEYFRRTKGILTQGFHSMGYNLEFR